MSTREEWHEWLSSHSEWPRVPDHTQQAMLDYLTGTYPASPGSWFYAVVTNNLVQAVVQADMRNRAALVPIVGIIHDKFPSHAWGSPELVQAWWEEVGR